MPAPNVTVTQNNQEVQTTLTTVGVPTGILQTGGKAFGQVIGTAVLWADRPNAADNSGQIIAVSNVGVGGRSYWFSDGKKWRPMNGRIVLAQSTTLCGIPPSGAVAANGALTLGTALNAIYDEGVFMYFPADGAFTGSLAGLYWTVMSSTSLGTIYNNTMTGVPTPPTNLVPIVDARGSTAYTTPTAANITTLSFTLQGGLLSQDFNLERKIDYVTGTGAAGKVGSFTCGGAASYFHQWGPTGITGWYGVGTRHTARANNRQANTRYNNSSPPSGGASYNSLQTSSYDMTTDKVLTEQVQLVTDATQHIFHVSAIYTLEG